MKWGFGLIMHAVKGVWLNPAAHVRRNAQLARIKIVEVSLRRSARFSRDRYDLHMQLTVDDR